jgi:hypothetical protein
VDGAAGTLITSSTVTTTVLASTGTVDRVDVPVRVIEPEKMKAAASAMVTSSSNDGMISHFQGYSEYTTSMAGADAKKSNG